jgi:hypothetical protein
MSITASYSSSFKVGFERAHEDTLCFNKKNKFEEPGEVGV